MKPSKMIAVSMSLILLAANGTLAPALAAAAEAKKDGLPETLVSTGTARLTELSQETLAAAPAAVPASDAAARPKAAAPQPGLNALVDSISTEPVDFNFRDTDIQGILRGFALKFGKNIIAAPNVSGKVNIQLHGVAFDEAFRILLDQMGLVAIQRGEGVIEIIKSSSMPVLSQVFPLRFRFAADLGPMLIASLDKKEREFTIVSVDNGSNSVIVTSTNDVLHKMKLLVAQVDIPAPQIAIKARLIEVQAGSNLNWGINWSGSLKVKNGTVQGIKDQSNYTVNPDGSINTTQAPGFFPSGGILDISSVMNKATVFALLNAIKADSRSKTLSEPMVLTGNNKTAKIHVGQNLPVVTSQVTQTATTQSVTYIPEGVDLEVTPIVSPGSSVISFRVRINVADLVGFQDRNPITSERTATTEASVESGMTVVIGGMIKDQLTETDSGIPLLKSIPLIGWLFKNKTKNKTRTELLIFLTPELQPHSA